MPPLVLEGIPCAGYRANRDGDGVECDDADWHAGVRRLCHVGVGIASEETTRSARASDIGNLDGAWHIVMAARRVCETRPTAYAHLHAHLPRRGWLRMVLRICVFLRR